MEEFMSAVTEHHTKKELVYTLKDLSIYRIIVLLISLPIAGVIFVIVALGFELYTTTHLFTQRFFIAVWVPVLLICAQLLTRGQEIFWKIMMANAQGRKVVHEYEASNIMLTKSATIRIQRKIKK